MDQILFNLGAQPVTVLHALAGLGAAVILCLGAIMALLARAAAVRRRAAMREDERSAQFEARLADIHRASAEMSGRLQSIAEVSVTRQSELARTVNDRLDKMSDRLGQSLTATTQQTTENLSKLNERLAVIDNAQKNITDLSSQVMSLQGILSNKQARGAFGQGRMEQIVRDNLPRQSYAFQATLSNGNRPDCVVYLPNSAGHIVIDAKFPLEGFSAFKDAEGAEGQKQAATRLRQDVHKHIKDIAQRYIVSGETQDTAIMFVPSESIYADLHETFDDLIQRAYRERVVIVSPSMLMLAIQVMQAILKDAHMREQAHVIQKEVQALMDDVHRLRDRVLDLQRNFGRADEDVKKILISSDKIAKRGLRIGQLEIEDGEAPEAIESEAEPGQQPGLLAGE